MAADNFSSVSTAEITSPHIVTAFQNCSANLSLSILTAIFPREPGLAGFIEAKDDGTGGNWSYRSCNAPVKSSPPTINKPTPNFLQAGCLSCHPTNSVNVHMFVLLVFNDTLSTIRLYRVIGVWNIYCVGPGETQRNIDKPNKRKIHTNTLFHLGFVEVISPR